MYRTLFNAVLLTTGLVSAMQIQADTQDNGLNSILVHPNSDRDYRAIELPNGLRALLIHDADTDKAAASLDVKVGSGNDPLARQGMAHFLEHMLFLGTEPFPEAGEYQAYLSANGGRSNAYTTYDHTNYYFEVDGSKLEGALDRFAPFFSAPLFTADLVDRERNAVHSEYTAKIKEDGRRYFDALKQIINPEHPFSKFTVGNLETLAGDGTELAEEVRQFWLDTYSANLMALAVIGPQDLNTLEAWVVDRFSAVPNHQHQPMATNLAMFTAEDLPSVFEVKTLRESRSMTLMFPIPEIKSLYRIKPTRYIASLLGHEGEGSWFAELRERGWAESLSAGAGISNPEGATFMVSIELTPDGQTHIDDIIELGFEHIRLVETQGIEDWRHAEQGQLLNNEFQFLSDAPAQSHARSMARALQTYPVVDLIRANYAWDRYEPETIAEFLSYLTPENMILSYSGPEVDADQQSPWYETPYRQIPLDAARLDKFQQARTSDQQARFTRLPQPNPFIASRFELIKDGIEGGTPSILDQAPGFSHWHLADGEFDQPKADIYIRLASPSANATPEASIASRLIANLVKDQLNTQTYPALLAGLSFDVYRTLSGITLVAKGYDETAPELAKLLAQAIASPQIDPQLFELIRQDMIRDFRNQTLDAPYEILMRTLPTYLIEGYWSNESQLSALESLTTERTGELWQALLEDARVNVLTHGNLTADRAMDIGATITQIITPTSDAQAALPAIASTVAEGRIVEQIEHPDRSWVAYFTQPNTSVEQEALLRLLGQMVQTPFYTELRTQRQLGYIVFAGYMPMLNQPGLVFTVQSPDTPPQAIETAAFEFFEGFINDLDQMSPEAFEDFKAAVLSDLTQEDTSLSARSTRFWRSLGLLDYEFDRRNQVIGAVEALTQADVQAAARILAQGDQLIYLESQAPESLSQTREAGPLAAEG